MKHSHILAGLALGLSLSAIAPAQAEPANGEVLVAQLRGHVVEDPIEVYRADWLKFKFEDYAIGRIRGVTGDVAQVQIISPSHITMTYDVGFTTGERDVYKVSTRMPGQWPTLVAGADVIMKEVDGKWVIISDKKQDLEVYQAYAMPQWVSRLDLREVALVERTALDWDRPDVSLPPLRPSTAVITPAPTPEPVPGLW
ncbi:hypothetical protein VB715_13140 [Crocosphaera sp. UHCC 0190]|uniref:hypothetical protein n=1 Tax=Crocosphaera sp. UHCC 0190 TaxID=3110246 RepID=UPI002B214B51|nr:hypothetical protein [Crocosphaera sp. UHCC 0190]MEA5510712.1 hypothetical protein [Crocosphaera sp. UHCC 0190]